MVKASSEKAGIREVYDLVEREIGKVNATVLRLENKFDTLEAGRLSNLETKFADFKGEVTGRNAVIAGVVAFIISLGFIVINHYWK